MNLGVGVGASVSVGVVSVVSVVSVVVELVVTVGVSLVEGDVGSTSHAARDAQIDAMRTALTVLFMYLLFILCNRPS